MQSSQRFKVVKDFIKVTRIAGKCVLYICSLINIEIQGYLWFCSSPELLPHTIPCDHSYRLSPVLAFSCFPLPHSSNPVNQLSKHAFKTVGSGHNSKWNSLATVIPTRLSKWKLTPPTLLAHYYLQMPHLHREGMGNSEHVVRSSA